MHLKNYLPTKIVILIILFFVIANTNAFPGNTHDDSVDSDSTVIEKLEKTHIESTIPDIISQEIKPGFFYRVKATNQTPETVIGAYTQSVTYYESSLTEDECFKTMQTHVFAQTKETNYLGVCFFGVWIFGKNNFEIIQIPVRSSDNGRMFTSKPNNGTTFRPRRIWKTAHNTGDDGVKKEGTLKFEHVSCKGGHTEEKAIEYLEDENTQKALWGYFLRETDNKKVPTERVLDCIGLHFLSSHDACDSCLQKLLTFQQKRLKCCPLQEENARVQTQCTPVPFIITFTSKLFYHPELPNFNELRFNYTCSGSMLFYPRPRLLRLGGILNKGEQERKVFGFYSEEEIEHQKNINLQEKEEFNFIVLMVNNGKPVSVNYTNQ